MAIDKASQKCDRTNIVVASLNQICGIVSCNMVLRTSVHAYVLFIRKHEHVEAQKHVTGRPCVTDFEMMRRLAIM